MSGFLGLAAGMAGGLINAASTAATNRANRKFAMHMYDKQYQDNIALWNMQNEYNHPSAQMDRLRKAGLNPRLMYGTGSGANTAGSPSPSTSKNVNFQTPQYGDAVTGAFQSYMDSMYNLEIKQAQVDNLRAQNTTILNDSALKAAQVANTQLKTKRGVFDLGLAEDIAKYSVEAAQENVRKIQADTKFTLDSNERAQAMNASNLKEAAERILNSRISRAKTSQEIKNLQAQKRDIQKSTELKQLDINLKKNGIQPTDSIYWRVLGQVVGRKGIIEQLEGFKKFKN